MSEQLVNYIVQQVNAGHRIDDIEAMLKSHGYDAKDVSQSIKTAIDLSARSYISYLDSMINSGYSLPQIRAYLVNLGHDYRIVDEALNHYHKNFFTSLKEKLVSSGASEERRKNEEQIKTYAEQGLSYGLTLENIQSNLISQGYDVHLVHKVVNSYRQSHFHIPRQLAFTLVAVLLVSLGVLGLFQSGMVSTFTSSGNDTMQGRLLDLTAENAHPSRDIGPGDDLYFAMEVTPMGYEREFDIDFTYEILDRDDQLIRRRRDTKSVVSNLGGDIAIPESLSPGTYTFKVIAEYMGDVEARASFEFDVVDEEDADDDPEEDPEEDQEEPDDDPEEDIDEDPEDPEDDEQPEIPDIDDSMDLSEAVDQQFDDMETEDIELGTSFTLTRSDRSAIRSLINRGEEDYARYRCEQISNDHKSEACLQYLAVESGEREFCESIDSSHGQDRCHLELSRDSRDMDDCDNIESESANRLCKLYVIRNHNLDLQDTDDREEYMRMIGEIYG